MTCNVSISWKEKQRQSNERPRKRKRIMSIEDKMRMSADYSEERDKLDELPGCRQCNGPGCTKTARVGSKYCSDECGIQLAVRCPNSTAVNFHFVT